MLRSRSLPFVFLAVAFGAASLTACDTDETSGETADAAGFDAGSDGGQVEGPDDAGIPPPTRAEFGLDTRPANTTCKAPARPQQNVGVAFEPAFANLGQPMVMAQRPGDPSRWYVARRGGALAYFPASSPPARTSDLSTAANLATLAGSPGIVTSGEGGFLGFAFHPGFAQNGKAYVSFTAPAMTSGSMSSVVAELTSTDGGDTFTGYKQLLRFDQTTATNHKGGGLAFGKDGRLFVSFGDGGGGNDQFVKGQSKTGYFSKVLRIDVDAGGQPEIYAYGLRNPFRISVDRASGDLWVADVGQNEWEEINLVREGGNYGWPCREGKHDYITPSQSAAKCPSMSGLLDPVMEHRHSPARSITGGVVYRGTAIPGFVGTYVYGDYVTQELFALSFDAGTGEAQSTKLNEGGPSASWVSFAEDANGEVYAVALNQSTAYRLVASSGGSGETVPERLSETGCKDFSKLVPFGVNAELWSDGAQKERFMALPDGTSITIGADGDFDFPNGTVLVKSFKLQGRYVETRLFVRHDDGEWAGYTYEWDDAQTDATLVRGNKTKRVGTQDWYFPSQSDCVRCHTAAAGRALGPELGQLNGDFVYTATDRIANQLRTLEHLGMFAAPLDKPPAELPVIPRPVGGSAPLDVRARAYLHANCSGCHRPGGGGGGALDLRFTTSFEETAACNGEPQSGTLGVEGAKLLVPGEPAKSLLSLRPHALGAGRMPPLGSSVVDTAGLQVVDDWIRSIAACP